MFLSKTRSTFILRWLVNALLIGIILLSSSQVTAMDANVGLGALSVEEVIQQMTPEEKVGQLFLITFDGIDLGEDSKIYDLVVNNHIGGVVLRADHDNFVEEETLSAVYQLTSGLQNLAWQKTQIDGVANAGAENNQSVYVPLFIGISQEGNGYPSDQILTDLTALPSALALGATWNPTLATQSGVVLGKELSVLGFNLYLGPSLDLVDTSNVDAAYYLGTRSFGGDPYWVGEMGKAFIEGVHQGSENKIAVIAKHFPGQGGSDRPPEEEVATVRKSLEQLKLLELAPFFSVTGKATSPDAVSDGLMVSHIRYQGFQGNIRATTKPVSFDATALAQLMELDAFSTWRADGGLMVSDSLGSRAVRRFIDPTEETFEAWQVARTAFLAGNDLLYLNDFIAMGDPDAYTSILHTLEFFAQKYSEDPAFAQRVDTSVLRILNSKIRLYQNFKLENVLTSESSIATIGKSEQVSFDVAQQAITLISPTTIELDNLLPSSPALYEQIVIFSDVRNSYQCSTCSVQRLLSTTSFENALLSLYGPQAGNQILQNRLSSYSFGLLIELLDNISEPSAPYLSDNLARADWVIFNILDLDPTYPESIALRRILSEREDLLRDKNVIIFSYDAPFYLDATEISKVTAYYGLFSRVPAFVDVAARVLMQELTPLGALPVSVSSVGYDLIVATSPDPNQIIPLELMLPEGLVLLTPIAGEVELTLMPILKTGETIVMQAGVIVDHNQNPVPDGTVVRFTLRISGENIFTQQVEATTVDGIAGITYRIDRGGTLEVTASSEPALISNTLVLNIEDGSVAVIAPTNTPEPSPLPTEEPTVALTSMPTPGDGSGDVQAGFPNLLDWFLALLVISGGFGLAYLIGYYWWGSMRWGLRSGFCAAIGGLLTYIYLNLGVPSTIYWMQKSGTGFVLEVTFVGIIMGWIVALIWWMIKEGNTLQPDVRK